ncbi:MAG: CopG family transcriptional regulator [Acidimicrobiales bacterium]
MRTTVTLDDDVAAAVARLQREGGVGVSAAINQLLRTGLTAREPSLPFKQRTSDMGARIDVTNVAEVLDLLDAR